MNLPLFIARRIYSDQGDRHKVSRPAIRIATIGVAIGLAVMIITVSVVLGFKHTIRNKVVGFGSHIQVMNLSSLNSTESHSICIDDSIVKVLMGIEGVRHVQRYSMTRGILKTDDDFLGVAFKGIGPEYELDYLQKNLVEGQIPAFSDTTNTGKLLLSRIMADKLNVKTGDRIYAYFIDEYNVRTRRFTIEGIYQTNMTRFDEVICYTDLYTASKLNGWLETRCSGGEVLVSDFDQLDAVYASIIDKVNRTTDAYGETYSSRTIRELNPQIFYWLDLLDLNVWVILGLMIAVAGVTMVSGLLIIMLERTSMIGLLKALGARNATIRHTFLWLSTLIVGKGLLWGNIVGIGLLLLQRFLGVVHLNPEVYYVSVMPVEINLIYILLLNILTMVACLLVLILPTYFVSFIHKVPSAWVHYCLRSSADIWKQSQRLF